MPWPWDGPPRQSKLAKYRRAMLVHVADRTMLGRYCSIDSNSSEISVAAPASRWRVMDPDPELAALGRGFRKLGGNAGLDDATNGGW